jgi:formamidopyrimidine-DNA glycosylase
MIEIPEAVVISQQLNQVISGKRVKKVIANQSPHKLAWFFKEPQDYPKYLEGKLVGNASNIAGMIELVVDDYNLVFGEGINLRFFEKDEKVPLKHQLCLMFEDESSLTASVQMYGGMWCFKPGENDNIYYHLAKAALSPLSQAYNNDYFMKFIDADGHQKLSVKALLATEQRIPGLGNGVLQDILYHSFIHPKRKVASLSLEEKSQIYNSLKSTLSDMVELGGRDTEKDLFGKVGGYVTKMSKNTVGKLCETCGVLIVKEAYMGGSVYYCPECQKI